MSAKPGSESVAEPPAAVARALQSVPTNSRGVPLDPVYRSGFESQFGADFGDVRVHRGPRAAQAAKLLGARAFTLGSDVVFGAGEYQPQRRDGRQLLAHELTHVVQQTPHTVRRQPLSKSSAEGGNRESEPAGEPAGRSVPGLIVEDGTELAPGVVSKSVFLSMLRPAVQSAAQQGLGDSPFAARGAPWIEQYLAHYQRMDAGRIERDIMHRVPEAAGATDARSYVEAVSQRVQRAASEYARTGRVTGLPEGVPLGLPGMRAANGFQSLMTGMTSLLLKARPGAAPAPASPLAVSAQLGPGRPLPSSVQSRMRPTLGAPLDGVRLHSDGRAAALASRLHARAFTVGRDVAFGPGEYRPGTVVGDALLAHELAHVTQQPASSDRVATPARTATQDLENDANLTAAGAVASLHLPPGHARSQLARRRRTRSAFGLSLLRCESCQSDREREIGRLGGLQYEHLEQRRRELQEERRRQREEEARRRGEEPPTSVPEVTLDEALNEEVKKSGFPTGGATAPTAAWDNLSPADQTDYRSRRAPDAWNAVIASVRGTELETLLNGKTFNFDPETALQRRYYAWQDGSVYNFGMSWVHDVEADPRNAWPNVAHEMGGHFEYGRTYASEIMNAAIERMPEATRRQWREDAARRQEFFLNYEYPETEIFSALRERRYAVPEDGSAPPSYGGLRPDANIDRRLRQMKDVLHPEVARAVLAELRRRVDANAQILQRDKDFFVSEVQRIFSYEP